MNENYMDEPKKSGTALKVVLIIITVIAVVAAVAMGLLFYNASSTLDMVREKNDALTEEKEKAEATAEELQIQITEYETEIADLTTQLEELQEQLDSMVPTVNGGEGEGEGTEGGKTTIDLSGANLSVTPDELYEEGVAYEVDVAALNLRSGPGTTYNILSSVNKDASVTAYAEDGEWLLVCTADNDYGWVKASFVTKK